jgi:CO/xanthine dehydrogenase Mo-binding subunit
MVASKEYRVIGTRPIRPDGTDKVTGRATYGADVHLTNMLYGRVKRSPHAHARIKRIDTSKAEALPGVKAVCTAADFPLPSETFATVFEGLMNVRSAQENFLAKDKVLYVGMPVAAVAAVDVHTAEDAIDLIEVEYEVLPAALDVREAMQDGAPVVLPYLRTRSEVESEGTGTTETNVALHRQWKTGDVNAGFAEADVIVEREFTTTMTHQGYIEPQNAVANWKADGTLTIWASTQATYAGRNVLARVFDMPVSKITWMAVEIGGGFGGKLGMYLEPLAALLSKKTGKPVKMTMTRDEVFNATGPTSGTYIRVKAGARKDGTLVAGEAWMAFEAGAFPGSPLNGAMNGAFAPYRIPNIQIDGYDVVVNKPKTAAYRAPGTPAGMFASESVMNELAERLGMDPLEFRIHNAAREGDPRPMGSTKWGQIGNAAVMDAMLNSPHWKSELQGENVGRGIAIGFWGNVGNESSSSASVYPDGTVQLVLGSVDIGGTRASLAMQLAETLGIDASAVIPRIVDTDSIGYTAQTGGSRTTFAGGWVAYELGQEIRKQMTARAAKIWECEPSEVVYGDNGVLKGPNDAEGKAREMTFKQLAAQLGRTGGTLEVGANSNHTTAGPAFGGHIVDLQVDPDTGKATVLRYTAVQDVGTAIHPSYVEGQIQGGVAQGLGMALTEGYVFDKEGRVVNNSFLDYRMPTSLDLPMIETILVEVPNPGHPYGVRGVGEVPIVPPLAAAQAALAEATGHHFTSLPMSARVVLEALVEDDNS